MKKTVLIFLLIFIATFAIFIALGTKLTEKKQLMPTITIQRKEAKMEIRSNAFENNAQIPAKYTCQGDSINPEFSFLNVPDTAKSLVLIMDDPDAPSGTFTHWVLFNIDPKVEKIEENSIPKGAVQGLNGAGGIKYVGPCPPSGTHRYFFKLYALSDLLSLPEGAKKQDVENAMKQNIIREAELIGLYAKK